MRNCLYQSEWKIWTIWEVHSEIEELFILEWMKNLDNFGSSLWNRGIVYTRVNEKFMWFWKFTLKLRNCLYQSEWKIHVIFEVHSEIEELFILEWMKNSGDLGSSLRNWGIVYTRVNEKFRQFWKFTLELMNCLYWSEWKIHVILEVHSEIEEVLILEWMKSLGNLESSLWNWGIAYTRVNGKFRQFWKFTLELMNCLYWSEWKIQVILEVHSEIEELFILEWMKSLDNFGSSLWNWGIAYTRVNENI